jgi:hypothetical protein
MRPRQVYALRRLFEFYGLLELAALAGVIGSDLPDGFRRQALHHLQYLEMHDEAQEFWGDFRSGLMSRFRVRIETGVGVVEEAAEASFSQFLAMNMLIENDPDADAFWEALQIERGSGPRFIDILRDEETFIRAYASHRTQAERQLHGLMKILDFSEEFEAFWHDQAGTPVFQEASLQYHRKWYQHRELEYLAQQLLDRFVTWNGDGAREARECLRCVAALVQRSRIV